MKVLLTGSSGFVGRHLSQSLTAAGHDLWMTTRHAITDQQTSSKVMCLDLSQPFDLRHQLEGIEVIVHTAAMVHHMHMLSSDQGLYHLINCEASYRLAKQAREVGVKHFVYLSSIKVLGEMTVDRRAFLPTDPYSTHDAYGTSKANAEQALLELAQPSFSVTVVRPPLIYGAGVGANLARLMQWVHIGLPCPFAAVENHRTLLAIENLQAAIELIVSMPKLPHSILHLGDAKPISTLLLFSLIASAMQKKQTHWRIPTNVFHLLQKIPKMKALSRLTQSLEVNLDQTQNLLNWMPSDGNVSLSAMVQHWLKNHE